MKQKYYTSSVVPNNQNPYSKISSWQQFKGQRRTTIKNYLLELLSSCDAGMTTRQISNHSGIWVQSLTNPLKSLVVSGQIAIIGITKSSVSNRMVQVYGISKSEG